MSIEQREDLDQKIMATGDPIAINSVSKGNENGVEDKIEDIEKK